MYAMQYEVTLPADYDMGIIRERVRTRGALLDAYPGLGLKAYCVRERGLDGSPVNQYAPFYLWTATRSMAEFLGGAGFRGLCESFGRPLVRHWTGTAFAFGPARAAEARLATRQVTSIEPDEDVGTVVRRAVELLEEQAGDGELHSAALAIDPHRWEVVRFCLWHSEAPTDPGAVTYRVLHLSSPEIGALPESVPHAGGSRLHLA